MKKAYRVASFGGIAVVFSFPHTTQVRNRKHIGTTKT